MCANVGSPMRAASPVSGGASNVASIAPLESATKRFAAGPLASNVTDWRGIFHSCSARISDTSCAPPKTDDADFLADKILRLADIFLRDQTKGEFVQR